MSFIPPAPTVLMPLGIAGQAAIAFGVLYAAVVSTIYVTLLFVVEPHDMANTESWCSC